MKAGASVQGYLEIIHRTPDGVFVSRLGLNKFVNDGLFWWMNLADPSVTEDRTFKGIAVGEGTTETADDDTSLESEIERKDLDVTPARETDYTIRAETTFEEGEAVGDLTEASLYLDDTEKTMIARKTFASRNKSDEDILTFRWRLTLMRKEDV